MQNIGTQIHFGNSIEYDPPTLPDAKAKRKQSGVREVCEARVNGLAGRVAALSENRSASQAITN
jgi:hypothetical protein